MTYGYVTKDGGFTVSVWFRRTTVPPTQQGLITQSAESASADAMQLAVFLEGASGSATVPYALRTYLRRQGTAGTPGAYVYDWTDGSAGYANDGEWHNVVLRLNAAATVATTFLDGNQMHQATLTGGGLNWTPGYLAFGGLWSPKGGTIGTLLWDGGIAHAAVWDFALSDSAILAMHAAGAGGTVYYGDTTTQRLERIFDWAGVPEQSRELDPPLTTLQGVEPADQTALSKIQETGASASGLVFADGQARMVFHNKRHRYGRTSLITLSEDTGSAPEMDLTFTVDDSRIYNDIKASRPFGGSIRLTDLVSQAAYGRKDYSFTLALTSHEELRNAAAWMLSQYSREQLRISAVTFRVESSEKLRRLATGFVQIGDRITLAGLPEPAPAESMEFFVEKIDVEIDFLNRTWGLTYELSPADIYRVAQLGVTYLGSGAMIGY